MREVRRKLVLVERHRSSFFRSCNSCKTSAFLPPSQQRKFFHSYFSSASKHFIYLFLTWWLWWEEERSSPCSQGWARISVLMERSLSLFLLLPCGDVGSHPWYQQPIIHSSSCLWPGVLLCQYPVTTALSRAAVALGEQRFSWNQAFMYCTVSSLLLSSWTDFEASSQVKVLNYHASLVK